MYVYDVFSLCSIYVLLYVIHFVPNYSYFRNSYAASINVKNERGLTKVTRKYPAKWCRPKKLARGVREALSAIKM